MASLEPFHICTMCLNGLIYIYIYTLSFWVYVSLFDEERKLHVFNIYFQICNVLETGLTASILSDIYLDHSSVEQAEKLIIKRIAPTCIVK